MMQHSANGLRPFEVSVYNREVREALKENQSHEIYGDHWADVQHRDVMAPDAAEAYRLATERYPADQGFVVEQLVQSEH
ncbi:MAG: hypothetical protein O3A84_12465 [Proteobacteria bacterium]|nr:hypothetical protein [Pseudomonadota bacterium]